VTKEVDEDACSGDKSMVMIRGGSDDGDRTD
jgi:hypothetical protein